jgi:hypothetical protein
MYGVERSGPYGYSLWELEVYGSIAAPTGLTATGGHEQVSLSWNAVPGATGYNVKVSTTNGGPYETIASPTTTGYTNTGLVNGTTYYYVVSQLNPVAESTNSTQVSATPACTPPPTPIASNNGPIWAGMTLNLTASSVPGASYRWTGPDGFTSTNQNPSIANASANLSGVFSVTAATGGCTSAPAMTAVTVHPPATVTVQSLAGNVILSWPAGTLQSATNVAGPWGNVDGAESPLTNSVAASQEFYRLRLQ